MNSEPKPDEGLREWFAKLHRCHYVCEERVFNCHRDEEQCMALKGFILTDYDLAYADQILDLLPTRVPDEGLRDWIKALMLTEFNFSPSRVRP